LILNSTDKLTGERDREHGILVRDDCFASDTLGKQRSLELIRPASLALEDNMDDWPDYITRAVRLLETTTGEVEEEEQIEAFASRWGGLGLDIFTQVLEEGKGEDRVLAILALGSSGLPEAPALLSPLLESPVLSERWASALALGEQQQAQARPVLEQMLFEEYWLDLPQGETPGGLWAMLLEAWRGHAARLLARWQDPRLDSSRAGLVAREPPGRFRQLGPDGAGVGGRERRAPADLSWTPKKCAWGRLVP
jgi:hypothetical protein